jgi:hypothetical protein
MFQMLVLANGQSNLLRVPGGVSLGRALGLGVALDLDVAVGLLPAVPVAPGDAVPDSRVNERPIGCPNVLSVVPNATPPALRTVATVAAGPHAASRATAPIDQAKRRPGVQLNA